jgi:hypothetical protein
VPENRAPRPRPQSPSVYSYACPAPKITTKAARSEIHAALPTFKAALITHRRDTLSALSICSSPRVKMGL